jgi:hypothetical protein
MKIETNLTESFRPIEVKLTIESELELKCLIEMARYNETIPNLIDQGCDEGKIITENFLNTLRHHLTKY